MSTAKQETQKGPKQADIIRLIKVAKQSEVHIDRIELTRNSVILHTGTGGIPTTPVTLDPETITL
ncbi:hypothetical protein ACQU0X_28940 [Pseudovibrio ascidiaceicola]|uniref:hypothetical protein n=1 Tax=Pseudovibrio ascidiaceicola TaxID=285279 RepID=UPI003D36CB62